MPIIRGPSRRARLREWAAQTRLRLRFERALTRGTVSELRRVGAAAAEAYADVGLVGIYTALAGHDEQVEALLQTHYRRVMDTFGERTLRDAKDAGFAYETKDAEGVYEGFLRRWIAENTGTRVTQIAGTTQSQVIEAVQRAVAQATSEGFGAREAAKLVRGSILERTGGIIGRTRSLVIARTEMHSASVAANQLATEAMDLPPEVRKEWLTANDGRVRDAHIATDGQVRNRDEPFNVVGESLMYPGDPAGSAATIINCRCVSAAVVPEGV